MQCLAPKRLMALHLPIRSSPMTDVPAGNVWQVDIVQLTLANATMRLANQALVSDNVTVLSALGFSHIHIQELRRKGGFRSSSIAQNTRLINYLCKRGVARAH